MTVNYFDYQETIAKNMVSFMHRRVIQNNPFLN